GLAAAGLTDDAERFTGIQVKRDTIHGLDDAVLREELRLEITDIEERTLPVPFGALLAPGWCLRYCHTGLPPHVGRWAAQRRLTLRPLFPAYAPNGPAYGVPSHQIVPISCTVGACLGHRSRGDAAV